MLVYCHRWLNSKTKWQAYPKFLVWSKMSELPREFNKITVEINKIIAKMTDFEERLDQAENTTTDLQNGLGFIETEYQTQKADLEYIKSNMVSKKEMKYIKEAMLTLVMGPDAIIL